jgi:hypothetical protein
MLGFLASGAAILAIAAAAGLFFKEGKVAALGNVLTGLSFAFFGGFLWELRHMLTQSGWVKLACVAANSSGSTPRELAPLCAVGDMITDWMPIAFGVAAVICLICAVVKVVGSRTDGTAGGSAK